MHTCGTSTLIPLTICNIRARARRKMASSEDSPQDSAMPMRFGIPSWDGTIN